MRRRSCLYIFEINSLSVASFAIIFSHSEGCLFTLLIVSFVVQKLLILIRSHLFISAFVIMENYFSAQPSVFHPEHELHLSTFLLTLFHVLYSLTSLKHPGIYPCYVTARYLSISLLYTFFPPAWTSWPSSQPCPCPLWISSTCFRQNPSLLSVYIYYFYSQNIFLGK